MSCTSEIPSNEIRCSCCNKLLVKDGKIKCPRCHTYCDIPTPDELAEIRATAASERPESEAGELARRALTYLPATGGCYYFMKEWYPDDSVRARVIEVLGARGWAAQIRELSFWERRSAPRYDKYMYRPVPMDMVMTLAPALSSAA